MKKTVTAAAFAAIVALGAATLTAPAEARGRHGFGGPGIGLELRQVPWRPVHTGLMVQATVTAMVLDTTDVRDTPTETDTIAGARATTIGTGTIEAKGPDNLRAFRHAYSKCSPAD